MASEALNEVKDCAKTIILDALKEWYSYITTFHDNIKAVQTRHEELKSHKDTIDNKIIRETDNLRKKTTLTKDWLQKVENLMSRDELKQLLDDEKIKGMDQCCFGRMQYNLKQRYKMSKAAEGIAKEIEDEIKAKPEPSMITEPLSVSELKSAPGEFLGSLQSRVQLMEKIIKKLEDDDVYIVGIFGMGAIGKTTLVKEISNRAKNKFGKLVMVEISEAPNMERIQYQIAEQLGLNLGDAHSVELRATKLYSRLIGGEDKKLVILDNIWEKFDLAKVGIPQQREFAGKLMVTSRKKDVCKVMGVEDTNIFEVHPLDLTEAKLLFRARVGKTIEKKKHEEVENRILNKCGGLPLSIVAIADVLKDKELSTWEHYACELEKPSSMHGSIKGANRLTNSILGTSYRLIESDEKRRFFLLACLFPFGSSIDVEGMMRYGIGKGLFQNVNNLSEAIEQANTWADELKSSSLLLQDDYQVEGVVKIQDVVRASTIELAKQDGEMFMVEAFPRWMDLKTCKKYTAISLMSGTNHSRLRGLKSHTLQILILDNTEPSEFDDTFCQHMENLKVLVLSRMKKCEFLRTPNLVQRWKSSLMTLHLDELLRVPNSIHHRWKSSLRVLHLEFCDLGDIGGIGELVNLVVLSLCGSSVEELLAEAMGNLVNLRLLDLRECKISSEGIPANVLGRLCQLEGLYLLGSNIKKWAHSVHESGGIERGATSSQHADDEETSIDDKYASIDELNKLSYLNVLEMRVRLEDLPVEDDQFVNNLERFTVQISNNWIYNERFDAWQSLRGMCLYRLDMRSMRIINCVKTLLLKTEDLILESVVGFEVQYLHQEKELIRWGIKHLRIEQCNKELVESIKWSAFPNLETLKLSFLENSSIEGHLARAATLGSGNTSIFANLRVLNLYHLKYLEPCVLPIHLLPLNHLTSLQVSFCDKLKYIFGEAKKETDQNKDPPLKLPLLKKLDLAYLNELESMVEVANLLEDEAPPTLFTRKVIFGALEKVKLWGLDKIVRMWDVAYWKDNADYRSAFLNLKELDIRFCNKLKTLCPVLVAAALVHLKYLKIYDCGEMTEAVKDDDKESDGHGHGNGVPFPYLEDLNLEECPKMGQFISAKQSYEFPSLQSLNIYRCHEMQSMSAGPSFRAPKLTNFTYDRNKPSIPEGGEINQFLKARYEQRTHRIQSERASGDDIGQQS